MDNREKMGFRVGIDGLFLLMCVVVFICGLIPPTSDAIMWTVAQIVWLIDVRNWSRSTWFLFNLAVVLVLIGIRFGPDLMSDCRERRLRIAAEQAKASKAQALKEQRETMERIQESRRRRMY